MTNKLNVKGIAIALSVLTAIMYTVCFIIVIAAGDSALKFFQLFFHGISLESLKTTPDIINGVFGFIISVISAYISGAIFAVVYNKFAK